MNRRYKPRRIADNSGVPWTITSGGLRTVNLADVTPKSKETGDEIDAQGFPILDAYDRLDGYGLAVWCRYCRKWHVHGHGSGHRVEHCHIEDSPYRKTGYILRPIWKPVPTFKNGNPKPPEGA